MELSVTEGHISTIVGLAGPGEQELHLVVLIVMCFCIYLVFKLWKGGGGLRNSQNMACIIFQHNENMLPVLNADKFI